MEVHTLLLGDWIYNLDVDIPILLAQSNYSVLIYSYEYSRKWSYFASGVDDFICNYIGGKEWTTQMQWPGQQGFVNSPEVQWHVAGQVAGTAKSYQGFTFLEVNNAGRITGLFFVLLVMDCFLP